MTAPRSVLEARMTPELLDAAKRASDSINEWLAGKDWDELRNKWVAIRLSDGNCDRTLYDSKRDAVKHQANEMLCAYFAFRNCGGGTTAREMAIFLQFNRDAYDAGFRLPDPDDVGGGPEVLMTAAQHDDYRTRLTLPPAMQRDISAYTFGRNLLDFLKAKQDRGES